MFRIFHTWVLLVFVSRHWESFVSDWWPHHDDVIESLLAHLCASLGFDGVWVAQWVRCRVWPRVFQVLVFVSYYVSIIFVKLRGRPMNLQGAWPICIGLGLFEAWMPVLTNTASRSDSVPSACRFLDLTFGLSGWLPKFRGCRFPRFVFALVK